MNETELVFQHGGEGPDLEKGPDRTEFDIESTLEAGEIGAWEWDLAGGQMRWSEQMFRNIGVEPAENVNLYTALLPLYTRVTGRTSRRLLQIFALAPGHCGLRPGWHLPQTTRGGSCF